MVIERVAVLKLAIFEAAMMAAFGLLAALMMLLFGSMFAGLFGHAAGVAGVAGLAALIFLPIMYGIFGFIAGVIGAALYNLIAGIVGGIELDVE